MKKILIAIVLATALAVPSFANFFNINLSGGYTTLAMTQVNNEIQDFANLLSASIIAGGGTATTSVTKLGNGYYVALDANFAILPVLMIGPRVEFVNAFEGKAESSGSVTIPLLGTVTETITDKYGVSLIPIMLGISYDASFPMVPISVKGGIYGGYGIATAYSDLSASEAGISAPAENETMSGSGFVGEILLSGDYSFAPFFSLGLNVGYRIANISQMKYTADVPDLSITKNSVVKDINQNTLPFDYSGLMVGLALNFGF